MVTSPTTTTTRPSEHCPPMVARSSMAFCNVISANVGYSVRSLTPEPAQSGDCVIAVTIGLESELDQLQKIWDFVMGEVPPTRLHCKRFRMLVFCKSFWRPKCNVTFDQNVGLECLAPLVLAGDQRFRDMIQDAMINIPANTVRNDRKHAGRRSKLKKILQVTGAPALPPYSSAEGFWNWNASQWKLGGHNGGKLDPARPRPLEAWVRRHCPASVIRMAVENHWGGEGSNGVFMAASQAVFKHPPQVYARLANTLTGKKPEACHILERMWRYLFGEF